jgi:glycosyltransferase involved in cell wall biosynthesis
MALHVCYVEAGYPHPHGGGGAGTYVRLVGRELVRRGVRVSVVASWCPDCPARSEDEGVVVHRPKTRGNLHWYAGKAPGLRGFASAVRYLELGWRWYRLLERLHRQERFSLVEFTEGGDFWHAYRPSFPFVVHLHGSRFTFLEQSGRNPSREDWRHRKLELAFIRRAARVFSPSRTLLDVVRGEMKGPLPPGAVLPYPLDPRLLELHTGTDAEDAGCRTVLFAARNDPVKGASVLLEAVPHVRRRVPDASFIFVGYEPSGAVKLPASVLCFPFMPREELLRYFRKASVCVVPSLWDNSPNTVYEAMASGKAVVASRVGGIPELVVDGQTGLLTKPGDAAQLSDAISALLLDADRRKAMGRAGGLRIQQLTNLAENVSRRLAVYQDVAA